jgi:uncharacterized protein YciI
VVSEQSVVPEEFDVHTVVVLRRAEDPPPMSESEVDDLQRQHLAYRAALARAGTLVVNGPNRAQSDDSYRGISIFACSPAEAAELSAADPSVRAGRLAFEVMEWWVRAGSLDFPQAGGPVGRRRSRAELA